MLEDIPESLKDRENKIIDIIKNNPERVKHDWFSIITQEATYVVSAQPVRIDGILINISASKQEVLAQHWDACLLTAKLCDLIHQRADITITPCPRMISSAKSAMILHSKEVDNKLKKYDTKNKLVSTCGKDWIIDPTPVAGKATNYGWPINTNIDNWNGIKVHPSTIPVIKVIQPAGRTHSASHLDYSQTIRFISRVVIGETVYKASEIIKNPKYNHLFF